MKPLEQEYQEAMELCRRKNKDYGNAKETMGSVYQILFPKGLKLETANQFGEFAVFQMIMTKVMRFANLCQSKSDPNFESIEDTLKDLGNYAFILKNLIHNNNEGPECRCGHNESNHAPIPETRQQPCDVEGCNCVNFTKIGKDNET